MTTYALTGATGKLGKHAIAALVERAGAANVVALARDPAKLADWAAKGVQVREADYDRPETLAPALAGVDRLLLISGNATGQRERQHGAVIDAAKAAGVGLIAYTSILHGPANTIGLAGEHAISESLLAASGVPHVLLRHGWYCDNYVGNLAPSIASGQIIGSAGEGRISGASRADLGEGDAIALVTAKGGEIFEFAGDTSFSMAELADEVSRASGQPVAYVDLAPADYSKALQAAGLPEYVGNMLADSSFQASKGALHDESGDLGKLIGRATMPIGAVVAQALG